MPEYSQIKWVKNVKRNKGTAWAYMEPELSQEFQLNFSESQKKRARNLREGEIILLFQKVDNVKGVMPVTYLTHLVTPLDDVLFFNHSNKSHGYERRVAVIARAHPNTAIKTNPRILNFFKPNWGKVCPIELLHDGWSQDKIAQTIWSLFASHFNPIYETESALLNSIVKAVDAELFSTIEGGEIEIMKRHMIRERNPSFIKKAKEYFLQENNGILKCECCDFVFTTLYGSVGTNFIECHHKQPISEGGERITKITDLAMVCSNCHRMLHRKVKYGYYTVEDLRKIVKENRES